MKQMPPGAPRPQSQERDGLRG